MVNEANSVVFSWMFEMSLDIDSTFYNDVCKDDEEEEDEAYKLDEALLLLLY